MQLDFPVFRPHPLVRGGHWQTIVGNYLPAGQLPEATVHEVPLPDGDRLALHEDPAPPARPAAAPSPRQSEDVVVLVHGLAGSHSSAYMLRCSAKLRQRGIAVLRLDLRGCGAGLKLARLPLHAGRSDDAAAVVDFVIRRRPHAQLHLVGFSMGANIVLKLAGELGAQGNSRLASVMGICPPIDLAMCTQSIQRGFNQFYDRRFARALVRQIALRNALVPDALTRPLQPRPSRLMDFDSMFTAPLGGFADVHDYYARASCGPLLHQIRVPALIITAATDPIVPVAAFERASFSSTTTVHIAPCGGHMGFVAARGADPDCRWVDWRIVDWVLSRSMRCAAVDQPAPLAPTSLVWPARPSWSGAFERSRPVDHPRCQLV